MEGVERVEQLDDTHLHWVAEIAGKRDEWTPRSPNKSRTSGLHGLRREAKVTLGVVTFHRSSDDETRVTVQLDWQPEGMAENVGTALGFDDRQVSKDLERFKERIEARGTETGAWRGEASRQAHVHHV
jgi:uncharacterized membrane protein